METPFVKITHLSAFQRKVRFNLIIFNYLKELQDKILISVIYEFIGGIQKKISTSSRDFSLFIYYASFNTAHLTLLQIYK